MGELNVRRYFEKVIVNVKVKTMNQKKELKNCKKKQIYAAGVEMVPNWVKA
jgi:hypothetical protein